MKMKLYLLLYNRVGDSQPGGCKRYQSKELFREFVLRGGGDRGGYTIDVGSDGEAKRLGTPWSRVKLKKILFFSIQLLYR
jgi:hypothetical protein